MNIWDIAKYIYCLMISAKVDYNYIFNWMSNQEEKDNIVMLPPQERVVAVALKHLFDEIRKIE